MSRSASREELVAAHIFHRTDASVAGARLRGLYGRVAAEQNADIASWLVGRRVLDVGAGFGTLTDFLRRRDYDVIGIEPDAESARRARDWYDLDLLPLDIYDSGFASKEFDTVILREVVFHLDFDRALSEISRICRKRVLVFQGNSAWLRRLGRRLWRHKEHNEKPRDFYVGALERAGFKIAALRFRDVIAFPLSGGFVGRPLVPDRPWLGNLLLTADRRLNHLVHRMHMEKAVCFRFLLAADLP